MAQDIKKLFKNDQKTSNDKMPKGHEVRFLQRLEEALPKTPSKRKFSFLNIAAGIVLLLGLGYAGYEFTSNNIEENNGNDSINKVVSKKSIGDVSPELKKVEDYYLASINLELSKIKITPENKELFDGYINRLQELKTEYDVLSIEFINFPNEQSIDALIENLKLRLNLMYRLKEKLKELNNSENIV